MKALQILLPDHLIELINGILLVDLDGDVNILRDQPLLQCQRAVNDILRILQHRPMIGRNKGLALCAIDDQCINID